MSRKVACWFSQKKKKKVSIDNLRILLKKCGVDLAEIDFDRSLEEQGPFDAVVHKLTDLILDEMDGNKKAAKQLHDFQSYLEKYPTTIVIDPLFSIRKLLNRYETYKLIRDTKICKQDNVVHVPTFILILSRDRDAILQQMKEADVHFPIMCKKNIAHGTASHKMSIIFNGAGLADVDPPCVAQTFIDHGAQLYKIYMIAEKYHMVERPSLRNFSKPEWKNHATIFFNSHDISSGDSLRSQLTTLDDVDDKPSPVDQSIVLALTEQLHQQINMTMYGIDVIVCPKTKKHYVIDVNVFPGYDGVENYLQILVEKIMERIEMKSDLICNGDHSNGLATVNGHDLLKSDYLHNGIHSELNGRTVLDS